MAEINLSVFAFIAIDLRPTVTTVIISVIAPAEIVADVVREHLGEDPLRSIHG